MRILPLAIACLVGVNCPTLAQDAAATTEPAAERVLEFVEAVTLPDFEVDDRPSPAKIHTQGLYVTGTHIWVTGRLESKPKRSLLIRYPRANLSQVEFLDITPPLVDGEVLDHPGGFDVDSRGRLQIPVSTSHRRGPTLIQAYQVDAAEPLKNARLVASTKIDDHLGAVCCHRKTLIGANWDTQQIYYIRDGKVVRKKNQSDMLPFGQPHIAVQDWKAWPHATQSTEEDTARSTQTKDGPRSMLTLMGGLFKAENSQAVVQWVDVLNHQVRMTIRLPRIAGVKRPVTNEGLAVYNGELFLLPEDLGTGAKLLRYRFRDK